MATAVDINPFPLGKIAPTSGTPMPLLNNFSDLVFTKGKVVTVFAPPSNTGNVYIGRATLNRSTLAGVLLVLTPGETKPLPFDEHASNVLDLTKFSADVDTTGDYCLPDVLFA